MVEVVETVEVVEVVEPFKPIDDLVTEVHFIAITN